MKLFIFFLIFSYQILFSQKMNADYYLDFNGNKINKYEIDSYLKYPDYTVGFKITKDSGTVYQLNVPKYLSSKVEYQLIKNELELITNKKYSDSTIFILNYNYLDDNCSSIFSNNVKKGNILSQKTFYKSQIKNIQKENKNIQFISLYDNSIQLKNNPKNSKEYFFSDRINFFRNHLFFHPTSCGSFGIINPNGETLVRNGEGRLDDMYKNLNPTIWKSIFQQ